MIFRITIPGAFRLTLFQYELLFAENKGVQISYPVIFYHCSQ